MMGKRISFYSFLTGFLFIVPLFLFFVSGYVYSQEHRSGRIEGIVLDSVTREPVAEVILQVDNMNQVFRTDESGKFRVELTEPGDYLFKISADEYRTKDFFIRLDTSIRNVTFEINRRDYTLDTIDVNASLFKKPEQANTGFIGVTNEDIRIAPGAAEDVIKYFQSSPGVAVGDDQLNDMMVRGGGPTENLLILDGIEIPNANHFASPGSTTGSLSYINLKMVDKVDFYTGGFPALYGDKLSSVMDIKFKEGDRFHHHQTINLSATGFGGFFEGPMNKNSSYMISIRRSYFELLKSFIEDQITDLPFPNYWDINLKLSYHTSKNQVLSLVGLGAIDRAESFGIVELNDYKWVKLKLFSLGLNYSIVSRKQKFNFSLSGNSQTYDVDYRTGDSKPDFTINTDDREFDVKTDYEIELSKSLKLNAVLTGKYFRLNDGIYSVGHFYYESYISPSINIDTRTGTYKASLGININGNLLNGVIKYNAGLMCDYFDYITHKISAAPRAGITYKIAKQTQLNLSAGIYYQSPEFLWLLADEDNRNLVKMRSENYVIGLEHFRGKDIRLNIEGYYKRYSDYPVSVYNPYYIFINAGASIFPNFLDKAISAGKGYFTGIDISLEKKNTGNGLYGNMNLSFTHSSFEALAGTYQPSEYDFNQTLTLVSGYNMHNEWLFGFRVRYAGGRPYTPFDLYNSQILGRGYYDISRYNAERLPYYMRVDVRVDKLFKIGKMDFAVYAEIWNLLNRKNVLDEIWSQKQNQPIYEYQWSLLPIIGFNIHI